MQDLSYNCSFRRLYYVLWYAMFSEVKFICQDKFVCSFLQPKKDAVKKITTKRVAFAGSSSDEKDDETLVTETGQFD